MAKMMDKDSRCGFYVRREGIVKTTMPSDNPGSTGTRVIFDDGRQTVVPAYALRNAHIAELEAGDYVVVGEDDPRLNADTGEIFTPVRVALLPQA